MQLTVPAAVPNVSPGLFCGPACEEADEALTPVSALAAFLRLKPQFRSLCLQGPGR